MISHPYPFAELVRTRVQQALATLEADGATGGTAPGRAALRRFLAALDELADAADGLRDGTGAEPAAAVLLVSSDATFSQRLQQALDECRIAQVPAGQSTAVMLPPAFDVVVAIGDEGATAVRPVLAARPTVAAVIIASDPVLSALVREFAAHPLVPLREPVPVLHAASAVRALLARRRASGAEAAEMAEPRSYAHLAGLLPRALEGVITFDAGIAIVGRTGSEPVVDLHAKSDASADLVSAVRERATALFRLFCGGVQVDGVERSASVSAIGSSLYVPLVTEGRVVGLTYLACAAPGAFTPADERVLMAVGTYASGAYRRLEGSVSRLRLTPRQSQILALVAAGLPDREIAAQLKVAHGTVRTHLDRLMREHGLRSRTEAVTAWLRGQQQ